MNVIYALADPATQEIRYVGKTRSDPRNRLLGHVRNARKPGRRQRRLWAWIRSLGDSPSLVILERDPPGELDEAERAWIAYLTLMGCRLCNMTPGGEGQPLGYRHSEEALEKLRSYRHSPESRAKISASLRGRKHSPETRMRMSLSAMGKPGTFNGRNHTAESIERMRKVQKGHPVSEETKAKISATKRARNAERRAKEVMGTWGTSS